MAYHQAPLPRTLSTLLSTERMGTYERIAARRGSSALELYVLDLELSAAFMADLALTEVCLRNAMDTQLSTHFGPTWYRRDDLFDERSRNAIKQAWRAGNCTDTSPPGKLIAELMLGFWVGLLDAGGYADRPPHNVRRSYDNLLWRPCLRHAFPHGSGKRSAQHTLAKRVQALRNRVAHHEPLIAGIPIPGTKQRRTVRQAHHDLVELMSSIDPELAAWISQHGRVSELIPSV